MPINTIEWIEWKWSPEKKYPETLKTKVFVKLRNGDEHVKVARPVSCWHSNNTSMSSWFNPYYADDPYGVAIVAYRLAE